MSKAKATRDRIIQQAATAFNQHGYAGTSMADIMQATGLQKGGIYNHFRSKDELALAAFDFAIACIQQHYSRALRGKRHAIARLHALVDAFYDDNNAPSIQGGCPLMNTAIESDDTHPALRDRARQAMTAWRNMIHKIVANGIKRDEVRATVEADIVATLWISILEGGLMMSQLYGDRVHLDRAKQTLHHYIRAELELVNAR
ncbi:MAG: TetR/AcrR family transcriptional regulator [Cyanobacteria bacterium P01_D01_bin.123]